MGLCNFGFHDWEVIDRFRDHDIKQSVMSELGIDYTRTRESESKFYLNRVCLRCGKKDKSLTERFIFWLMFYKSPESQPSRQTRAKELWNK